MKIDALFKRFFGNPSVFADVCNLAFHGGNPVVKPEDLVEMPTEESAVLGDGSAALALHRRRDLLMAWCPGGGPPRLLIGFEVQSLPDRTLAVSVPMYDFLGYEAQLQAMEASVRGAGATPMERLGAGKRLVSMGTLVIYVGTEPWLEDVSLEAIADMPGGGWKRAVVSPRPLVLRLNMLSARRVAGLQKPLQCLVASLRNARFGRARLKEIIRDKSLFEDVPLPAVRLISALLKMKIKIDSRKETVNMCQAVREMMEEERNIGCRRGLSRGRKEGAKEERQKNIKMTVAAMKENNAPDSSIVSFLGKVFGLTARAARAFL